MGNELHAKPSARDSDINFSSLSNLFQSIAAETESKATEITNLSEALSILQHADDKVYSFVFDRIQRGEIKGSADEYHNISVDYSKINHSERASLICR